MREQEMRMDILYELKFPDGRCWTTTPIYEQAIEAAKRKAKQDGIPMEVVKYNLMVAFSSRSSHLNFIWSGIGYISHNIAICTQKCFPIVLIQMGLTSMPYKS